MDLLVFGATGRTGGAFVREALGAGHAVTAFVRDAARLEERPAALTVVTGDVLDAASVAAAVTARHVVVSTLGGDPLREGTRTIVAAMTAAGATRLLAVVGAGVLQADAERLRNQLPDYPPRFRAIGAEHQAVYDALRGSALDWTLVCSPNLPDGPRTGGYRVQADFLPEGRGAVTTGDVAAFLLEEATSPRFSRRRVGINRPL